MNRILVTGSVALGTIGVLAAAMSGARAGTKEASVQDERFLVVTLVTPTNNQEVRSDLSDPGLNGVITVRFSSLLNPRDFIDNQNVVNRLSSKVEFLDSSFLRLPGTPTVRRNVFTFAPLSVAVQSLPQGQYTLNLKSSIRNTRGNLLNQGLADYTTTFSVGTDVYAPVLRKVSPINNQAGIGLFQRITLTFNEPIELGSTVSTITVTDASTNPPTAIPGLGGGNGVTVARNGFDVVFTPDPCFGYPPKTTIQMVVQGQSRLFPVTGATLTDVFQNPFERDLGLQWAQNTTVPTQYDSPNGSYDEQTGQFKLQFQTKGVKPPPAALRPGTYLGVWNPLVLAPCGAQLLFAPDCYVAGQGIEYTTSNGLGQIDLRGYLTKFNSGITDYSQITTIPNAPVRMGRIAGVTFDPRAIAPTANFGQHTFIYVVDERTASVLVVRSDSFKILGRLTGFSAPKDVSVSTDINQSRTTLYVSDFAANQLVGIDLEGVAVSFTGQPGAQSPCEAIKDNASHRAFITVGTGPTEVSADGFMQARVMSVNTLESSVSLVDVRTNKLLKTYEVGSSPVSCDWNTIQFGGIRVAVIANQGGLNDPDGSISLYLNAPPLSGFFGGAAQTRDGIESSLTEGVKNPTSVWGNQSWIDPPPPFGTLTSVPIFWYVANTGGTTVLDIRITSTGLFGQSITPRTNATINVGLNPASAVPDPYFPNSLMFASVLGTGSVAVADPARSIPPTLISVPGVRKLYHCYTH